MRKLLPPGAIETSREGLSINAEKVDSDYHQLQFALLNGDDLGAAETYCGAFLAGFPYITDEYDDWRISKAAKIHNEATAARQRAVHELMSEERYRDAAALAKTGLTIDELDIDLAVQRIRCLALAHDSLRAEQELNEVCTAHINENGEVPAVLAALYDFLKNVDLTPAAEAEPNTYFIGRAAERDRFKLVVDNLQRRSAALLITGDPGIGKTRLLNHLLRRLVISGARVFHYSASAGEAHLPFSTIAGLIRDGFRQTDLALLGRSCELGIASLLPDLVPNADSSEEHIPGIPNWDAVGHYLQAVCSQSPTAICVDNLQWTDESSRALLAHLSNRLSATRVLFAFGARPRNSVAPVFEDQYRDLIHLELDELTKLEVFELVKSFEKYHGINIAPDTAEFLYTKLGGRPFFLIEALNVLREMPAGTQSDWYRHFASSPTVSNSIIARIDRSSAPARLIAKAASIVDRPVPLDQVAAIAELSPADAAEGAADLVAVGVIKRSREIEFSHELIREAVRSSVPAFEAALWHSRIGAHMLQFSGGASEAAAHFENAGQVQLAYEYAKRAAAEACSAKAYGLEEEQYLRMIRCSEGESHRRALYDLVRFWARTGQYVKIQPHLATLASYLSGFPSTDIQLARDVALMELDERSGRLAVDALGARARHLINLAARGGSAVVATVVWHVAEIFRRSRQYALMREISTTLLRESERLGTAGRVEATAAAALLTASCDGYLSARGHSELAVELATSIADELLISRTRFVRGTVHLWSGDLIRSRADYEQAVATAQHAGAHQILRAVRTNFSVVLAEQADFDGAVAMAQQSLTDGGYRNRAYAYGNLALIHLRRGDFDEVDHYARSLKECHNVSPESWIPPHVAALSGLVDLAQGRIEPAIRKARFVTEHLAVAESVTDVSHLHILRARAALAQGQRGQAFDLLARAIEALEPFDYVAARRLMIERISHAESPNEDPQMIEIAREAEAKGAFLLSREASLKGARAP